MFSPCPFRAGLQGGFGGTWVGFPPGWPTHPPSPSVPLDAATRKAGSSAVHRSGEFRGAGATPRNHPRPSGRKLMRVAAGHAGAESADAVCMFSYRVVAGAGIRFQAIASFPPAGVPARLSEGYCASGIAGQGNHGGGSYGRARPRVVQMGIAPENLRTPACGRNAIGSIRFFSCSQVRRVRITGDAVCEPLAFCAFGQQHVSYPRRCARARWSHTAPRVERAPLPCHWLNAANAGAVGAEPP